MILRDIFASAALGGIRLLRRVVRLPPGVFRILLFHDISEAQEEAFDALMGRIGRTAGFITPAEAMERLERPDLFARDGRVPCLISFDDGFASNRQIADGVLDKHRVKALFFVCPGIIDLPPAERPAAIARGIFDSRLTMYDEAAKKPLMDWADIEALAAAGHEIGAHSMSHRRLAGLDTPVLQTEIGDSCRRLAEVLGRSPAWFAWPFGDIASIDVDALATISRHVRFCRSGVRGLNRPGQHRLMIFADHVDLTASTRWQDLTIAGGLDWRYHAPRTQLAHMSRAAGQRQFP